MSPGIAPSIQSKPRTDVLNQTSSVILPIKNQSKTPSRPNKLKDLSEHLEITEQELGQSQKLNKQLLTRIDDLEAQNEQLQFQLAMV